jgi:nitrate reductase assembly molybdenum cofactor insertion protein NarJ
MHEGSAIPLFWEWQDGDNGEREYGRELSAWFATQPQAARLLTLKQINWDSMDQLTTMVIDDPDSDIATIAWVFWHLEPSYHIANPDSGLEGGRAIARILGGLAQDHYPRNTLALDRLELLDHVQLYAEALAAQRAAGRTGFLTTPQSRRLLGPFAGAAPEIRRGNDATERHLDDIVEGLGSYRLSRTQADWWKAFESNYRIRHHMRLPPPPGESARATLAALDELAHIAALYGPTADYRAARMSLQAAYQAGR